MDSQEARIYTAIIITVIVLGIIILYFVISIIRQQQRNMALQRQNILAEISAMERERERIASDLHDDLGPILSVIKFQVDQVESVNEEEKEQLQQASRHLDSLIARMREIANNLMPTALRRKGLVPAITEYITRLEQGSGLKVEFSYPASLQLPEEKSMNLFRSIQELLHNCMKHAGATQVTIKLVQEEKQLVLLYRDNGCGFDPDVVRGNGIGLGSLKSRTEIMGGRMTLESKPGVGTAYLFEIPLK